MEQDQSPKRDRIPGSPGETEPEAASPGYPKPRMDAGKLSSDMERFSRLSSDLMECLSGLSRNLQGSREQLDEIQSAIDLKKEELKRLHDIDASATTLQQLIEDQRLRMESFESLMQSQHNRWEEEKARRAQEENECLENLKIQRQREEEEYRQKWAAEEQTARRKLDEESRALQLENRLKLEALEKDHLQRELILKEKELEWIQLVQELEQFMSRLADHTRTRSAPSSNAAALEDSREKAPEKDGPS